MARPPTPNVILWSQRRSDNGLVNDSWLFHKSKVHYFTRCALILIRQHCRLTQCVHLDALTLCGDLDTLTLYIWYVNTVRQFRFSRDYLELFNRDYLELFNRDYLELFNRNYTNYLNHSNYLELFGPIFIGLYTSSWFHSFHLLEHVNRWAEGSWYTYFFPPPHMTFFILFLLEPPLFPFIF